MASLATYKMQTTATISRPIYISIEPKEPPLSTRRLASVTFHRGIEAPGADLAELVGLDGVVGHNIEGLEVDVAVGDDHAPRLDAQGGDAAAHQLQHNLFVVVLQPPGIEALIFLMRLRTSGHHYSCALAQNSKIS